MKSTERPSKMGRRPSSLHWFVVGLLGLFVTTSAFATDYYVSPTGSDLNAGTLAAPFATIQKGADTAVAGDTVWLRGGTYTITTPSSSGAGITFSKSGTSDTNRINYFAYTGETPLIDFTNMKISTSGYTMGIVVTGSWLHFKGIEECCVPMNTSSNNGFAVDDPAGNDIFELLNMHGNSGNGIFIGTKQNGGHQIINCDSHDNYDATSAQGQGQNADGFGVHYQTTGTSTIVRGNRSWWNSDDGYDLINQEVPVTVENSWAFGMGYANFGTYSPTSGNGNGFKMGSSKTGIRHLVQNNVAWGNKANGFYANHSSGGNTWYNNTAFKNGTNFNMLASSWSEPNGGGTRTDGVTLTGSKVHIMRNNLAYPNTTSYITGYGVDTAFNTWDLNITAKPSDFLSITDPTVSGTGQTIETTSPALGPRQADGSLPDVDFLQLAAGSQMIDKGTDVGLPFVGASPDLGAYEFGAVAAGGSTGAGGAVGTGGTSGDGGAPEQGGATGAGGATGTGGRIGTGGSTAARVGGAPGNIGGALALGGTLGSGGVATETGGKTGAGGTSGVVGGGAVETGGVSAGTGGIVATGGEIGTGGSVGSGGASSTSAGAGGAATTGGTSGNMPAQGTGNSTGCSCHLAGAEAASRPGLALLTLLMFALRLRKRR